MKNAASEIVLTEGLFVEPHKDYWFVMGEYLPPPFGILQLAAFLEDKLKEAEIEVVDCQAMSLDWKGLEKCIESYNPQIVASSGFATCNAYTTARTLETAKKLNSEILTVTGGQHFTAMRARNFSSVTAGFSALGADFCKDSFLPIK